MRKKSIEDMHKLAQIRGGKCLSRIYNGCFSHLLWQCSEGHIWSTAPATLVSGAWCPECGKKTIGNKLRKYSIEDMIELAARKGGKCLSTRYIEAHSKLEWECSQSHVWYASPNSIRRGSWCPQCSSMLLTEMKCRYVVETLTGLKFSPDRTILGDHYQLDMFNANLNLAFEYNGQQHYAKVPYFHRNDDAFTKQQSRDEYKTNRCKQLGIKLIIIPYYQINSNLDSKLIEVITEHLVENNIPVVKSVDWDIFYKYLPQLQELKIISQSKGGECLSTDYQNARTNMKWQCDLGHQWEATSGSIKSGTWCPNCAPKRTSETLKRRHRLENKNILTKID